MRLAARVLWTGNAPTGEVLDANKLPAYFSRKLSPAYPTLENAADTPHFRGITRQHLERLGIRSGRMAEIGASVSSNARDYFREFEYVNIDIEDSPDLPTIVSDICADDPALSAQQFDFIYAMWVFEHLAEPWKAAGNITRLLKPGGLAMITTVFAWRYHPVPIDYWRFSPEALAFLFNGLERIDARFVSAFRRSNDGGAYPNGSDRVPLDHYGGWLENWAVYYVGQKPGSTC